MIARGLAEKLGLRTDTAADRLTPKVQMGIALAASGKPEALRYRGNVTGADRAQPGALLGHDEMGRPYEVIDAEYDPAADRTTVQLQYATADTLRAAAGIAS